VRAIFVPLLRVALRPSDEHRSQLPVGHMPREADDIKIYHACHVTEALAKLDIIIGGAYLQEVLDGVYFIGIRVHRYGAVGRC